MFSVPTAIAGPLAAFFQVVLIDVALAGDNAVAVGMAASGLPKKQRRQAIILGLALAVVMLIGFALIAVQLLNFVGVLLAGGVLLLWVCWKMWGELRDHGHARHNEGEETLEEVTDGDERPKARVHAKGAKPKTLRGALIQILIADLSMSLDNVLAVAGAARDHPAILVFGLLMSIALMGFAANIIARFLHKARWIGYVGLAVVIYVALHMVWEGHRMTVIDFNLVKEYNAVAPASLDITPAEVKDRKEHRK
ncbi:MAG: tellurium resistance protein TerC [Caulobacter sp.]|nr:tellurium resistance protein TerC [Caulobacter sp.]